MKYLTFAKQSSYPIAILIRESALSRSKIEDNYIQPLVKAGINKDDIIVIGLDYFGTKKPRAADRRDYMATVIKGMQNIAVEYVYVADSNYFQTLTKHNNMEAYYGYSCKSVLDGMDNMQVTPGVQYNALFFNPGLKPKLDMTLAAFVSIIQDEYIEPGSSIIESAQYPKYENEIKDFLDSLHQHDVLTCDIETFSLHPEEAGIGTVAFAWDQHNGGAFLCDYEPEGWDTKQKTWYRTGANKYGKQRVNCIVRLHLSRFFEEYKGTLIYHGVTFDAKILARQLFMHGPEDHVNQLKGIEIMTKKVLCTKILTYLATNNCVLNKLDLKSNAQEFAGNWAKDDIKDILMIPPDELLQYNLVDCLSTWYVFNKYYPVVKKDNQVKIYNELFKPAIPLIIDVELNGMPMNYPLVKTNDENLRKIVDEHKQKLLANPLIQEFNEILQRAKWIKENLLLKTKQHPIEKYSDPKSKDYVCFNPGSPTQLSRLVYEQWGFPITSRTKKGAPSSGAKILKGILMGLVRKHSLQENDYINDFYIKGETPKEKAIHQARALYHIIEIAQADKIITTFFKAFLQSKEREDGMYYLQGNFNLTGTKSGRLSSSNPNLQNLPSTGTIYAKMVKKCFQAPKGWIMCGADFDSLEDRISALTTKDPMKLKVYTDGYDGHCLRAFAYFGKQMVGIDPDSVDSINSIAKQYKSLRQDSKAPTFALTYDGTWIALRDQCGFTEEEAQEIERLYHELYHVSDAWKAEKIALAAINGYVEVAFGLRVRTPLLAKTDLNKSYTPYEAEKEARTAGNALGQSYCMLNNRAAIDFRNRVMNSPYKHDIKIICLIHDAIYLLVRDVIDVVKWVNDNLPDCMSWQELPDIQHDEVKLSGALDIFHPTWADEIGIPNGATCKEIQQICMEAMA